MTEAMLRHTAVTPVNLGERLRAYRVRRRIKQEAVAVDLGISQATVSRLESGTMEAGPGLASVIEELLARPENLTAFDQWRRALASLDSPLALLRPRPNEPELVTVSDGLTRWLESERTDTSTLARALAPAVRTCARPGAEAGDVSSRTEIALSGSHHQVALQPVIDESGNRHVLIEIRTGD